MADTYITINGLNPVFILIINAVLGSIFSGIGVGLGLYLSQKHIIERTQRAIKKLKKKKVKRKKR